MSFAPSRFRPLCHGGGGGRVDWRGASAFMGTAAGITEYDPQMLMPDYWGQIGTLVYRGAGSALNTALTGITRDSAGAVLGLCRVDLCQNNVISRSITSDAGGNYSFVNPGSGPFFLVAYKQGSPDVAGTTVNTLHPAVV